jgi:putative DNA primase/helicase
MGLDIDNTPAASEYLLARGVNLGQLFAAADRVEIVSGREGRGKLLFRLPTSLHEWPQTLQVKSNDGEMILEFRCADANGNSVQDVLPPSIHPDTGKPYQWVGDWGKLPTIPATLLSVWQNELAKKSRGAAPVSPTMSLQLPPGVPPLRFAPGFAPLDENLWGMTVVESALDHVSPDIAYDEWRNLVWAVMSTGWKSAPQIVHGWSKRAPHRYDPAAVDGLIRSFDPTKGITIATLFHFAKQHGWIVPQQYPLAVVPSAPPPQPSSQVSAYHPVDWTVHGDIRNARHFARLFHGRVLYVYGLKAWLRWSIGRWVLCDQGQEIEAAKQAAEAMLADATAGHAVDPDRAKPRVREAMAAHNLARMKATLELARSEPSMSAGHADLDANPTLLGVGNGVVDLRSGGLLPNHPDMLITRHCAADYDLPTACPRWLQFMDEVFGGDQATIQTVQRLLGYTLTGLNTEEIIVFNIGFGANGKSIFGNIVNRIIGGYSKVAPHTLLAARRGDDHGPRPDIAMLVGARLVSVNELPGGMQLDEQVVKSLASREPIAARHLFGEFITFEPRFTVWVRTNHRPIVKGDDDGIWRRLVIVPFRQKFTGTQRDPNLEAKLWLERSGILRWMIEGARQYLATGDLALSPAILAEQRQYRRESDLLGEFLADCTIADPAGRVLDKELFGKWTAWCVGCGHRAGGKATFTQRLAERGYPIRPSNGQRYYSGLRSVP